MAFVQENLFRDKRSEVVRLLKTFMDEFKIQPTRRIAGVYTVDLLEKFAEELAPLTNEQIDKALDLLIVQAMSIRGEPIEVPFKPAGASS